MHICHLTQLISQKHIYNNNVILLVLLWKNKHRYSDIKHLLLKEIMDYEMKFDIKRVFQTDSEDNNYSF